MSIANADLETIRKSAQSLKNALESISRTKSHLSSSYHQLGAGWNDKKYKELGDIIIECNKALSNLEKILLHSNKYVSTLVTYLQEYENVNFDNESDNPFIQNLRDMAAYSGSTSNYQYCMGVATRGTVSDQYKSLLSERHDKAEPNVRKVFDSFVQKLIIQDANYSPDHTPHYSPNNYEGHSRGVYLNTEADMYNIRGPGSTFYHELGHMIDHASTGYHSNLSNNSEFRQALLADGQEALNRYNAAGEDGQRHFRSNLRQNNYTHSFQDLLEGVTDGELSFYWGHNRPGRNYWATPGNLEAEAFAHFFEAAMGSSDKLELLTLWFPRATTVFFNMIDDLVDNQHHLIRSR